MNTDTVKGYFGRRITQLGLQGDLAAPELSALVDDAFELGFNDFWHAKKWRFRHAEKTLTITAEEDRYELPADVVAIANAREQTSLDGGAITFMSKDEFDAKIPSPSAHASGYPYVWTLYMDGVKLWIKFYPRPSVDTIYYDALLDTPENLTRVPSIASAALIATVGKYLYKQGTEEFREAVHVAEHEIMKLEVEQNVFAGEQWKFLDATDVQTPGRLPWYHSGDCR